MILKDEVVFSIDPSINNVGYAVFSRDTNRKVVVENKYSWHLITFGCFSSRHESTHDKIKEMSRLLKLVSKKNKVTHSLIEIPPEIIYLDDILTMKKEYQRKNIIARASRIMKLFSSGYYYIAMLREYGVNTKPILPVQWQLHKSKRKNRSVKEWSIDHANAFLKTEKFNTILSSGRGEHIADAINIGFSVLNANRANGFDGFS